MIGQYNTRLLGVLSTIGCVRCRVTHSEITHLHKRPSCAVDLSDFVAFKSKNHEVWLNIHHWAMLSQLFCVNDGAGKES